MGKVILSARQLARCPDLVLVILWALDEVACCRENSYIKATRWLQVQRSRLSQQISEAKFCPAFSNYN